MYDYIYHEAAAPPPEGVESDFYKPHTHQVVANAIVGLTLATVTLFAWTRLYIKVYIIRKLHVEDYLIPIAWLAAMGQITCGFLINQFAPFVHSWDMTLHTFGRYLLLLRLGAVFYDVSIVLMKVSVLIQILRIFVPHGSSSKTYWAAHALMWANIVYYTIAICLFIFTCDPVAKAWKPWLPGTCKHIGGISISMAAANLIGDLLVLYLTQKAIWDLMRVREKQRLKLSLLFFAGIIPCGFAIMCLVYSSKSVHTKDFSYDSSLMWAACYGEVSSGMFVLLLPVLPRFIMHLRDSSLASYITGGTRGVTEIEPSQVARTSRRSEVKDSRRKQSLWHVSYTEKDGDYEEMDMELTAVDTKRTASREKIIGSSSKDADAISVASTVTMTQYDEADMMEIGRAVGHSV